MLKARPSTKALGGVLAVSFLMVAVWMTIYLSRERIETAPGWSLEYLPGRFQHIDNLAFGPDGSLYATLEGEGKVVRILDGKVQTLMADLNRPDGLLYHNGSLLVTEEISGKGRVLRFDLSKGETKVLTYLNSPEGIAVEKNGSILVSEDEPRGRILRITESGNVEVFVEDLSNPEGLCVDTDGTVFVCETASGNVLAIRDHEVTVFLSGLHKPDQIKIGPHGALWVTEDNKEKGRLLRYRDGVLDVIATSLNAPQGIAFDNKGRVYVSEQAENRIVIFSENELASHR